MSRLRSALALALALSAPVVVAGCGGPLTLAVQGTQRDPGAEGRLQVETVAGGNHLLNLSVRYLTPPERLGDGNTVFMVWIRQPSGSTALASQLGYDPDAREGTATITTPLQRFTLLVTAERTALTTAPGEFVVLSEDVQF